MKHGCARPPADPAPLSFSLPSDDLFLSAGLWRRVVFRGTDFLALFYLFSFMWFPRLSSHTWVLKCCFCFWFLGVLAPVKASVVSLPTSLPSEQCAACHTLMDKSSKIKDSPTHVHFKWKEKKNHRDQMKARRSLWRAGLCVSTLDQLVFGFQSSRDTPLRSDLPSYWHCSGCLIDL